MRAPRVFLLPPAGRPRAPARASPRLPGSERAARPCAADEPPPQPQPVQQCVFLGIARVCIGFDDGSEGFFKVSQGFV